MRILVVLLVLTPAQLWSQSRSEPEPPREEPAAEAEAVSEVSVSDVEPIGPGDRADRQASAAERSHSAAVAQPTMSNFLYQVLLAAVTALVTALIWKAVF